jgi:hypothetical protein
MLVLTTINTVMNAVFLFALALYILFKSFYIDVERTVWCKKAISFYIMKKDTPESAHSVLRIPLRNREQMNDWDSEQFDNGNYKKYERKNK